MSMAQAREGQISLGGKTYRCVFSVLAIVSLRDRWGLEGDDDVLVRLEQIAKKFEHGKFDFKIAADIVWASLRSHHPEVPPDEVLAMLDAAGLPNLPPILMAVFKNLSASAAPPEAGQARPPAGSRKK